MHRKWWVLSSVACGTFMATLDSSIVNIALSTLTEELGQPLTDTKWVIVVYFFVITCLLLPFGKISDQVGRKKIFTFGFFVFTLGSALCGLSTTLGFLVGSRVVQAIGASMLMANGPALITDAFPAKERGGALGTLAMVVSLGLITGPSLGGFLISHLGWRSIFLLNVPIGLVGMALVYTFVRETASATKKVSNFDWLGAIVQTLFLVSFIYFFDPPRGEIFSSISEFGLRAIFFGLTILLAWIFYRIESTKEEPVFDLSLLKNKIFWTANLAAFLLFVSYSSIAVLMPYFMEQALNLTTSQSGLFMTAIPLTIFIIAPISGRLSDRLGSKELCIAGSLVLAVALFWFGGLFGNNLALNMNETGIILALALVGTGIGLFQSPNNNAIMASVPLPKLGVASALIATVRNLGLFAGAGFASGTYTWKSLESESQISPYELTFFLAGLLAVGSALASIAKSRGPHWK